MKNDIGQGFAERGGSFEHMHLYKEVGKMKEKRR